MKQLHNFFFMDDEQHAENYAWFYGNLILGFTLMAVVLWVTI